MNYKLPIIVLFQLIIFMSCQNTNKTQKDSPDAEIENQIPKDEVWKQFMKIKVSTMEKMPPDSGCVIILNHIKVSYYKSNKLEFADDLIEYMKNDSLIVYRVSNQPYIQIGYNRKDSVMLFTTGHPEGGRTPSGEMQYFARKVETKSPFQ